MIGVSVGNYVIAEKIGEGGMGVVYRASHQTLGRQVAVKVLHGDSHRAPELVSRFFNEAKAATEIRNEHIIDVLDFGHTPDGRPYIVMEWLEGESLAALLAREPVLEDQRALALLRGIGEALAAAHELGVIHRDLKPDNIFLQQKGARAEFIKVLDFGIAKLLQQDGPSDFKTRSGMLLGTPAYMSPEQCRGARDIDHRSDIYALGVIAYQMFTGQLPFRAEGLGELIYKHMSEAPQAPSLLRPSISGPVNAAILKALAKDPADRFGWVGEFIAAIEIGLETGLEAGVGAANGVVTGSAASPSVSNKTAGGSTGARAVRPISIDAFAGATAVAPAGSPPPPPGMSGPRRGFATTLSPLEVAPGPPQRRPPMTLIAAALVLGVVGSVAWWFVRGAGNYRPAETTVPASQQRTGVNPRARATTVDPTAVAAPASAVQAPPATSAVPVRVAGADQITSRDAGAGGQPRPTGPARERSNAAKPIGAMDPTAQSAAAPAAVRTVRRPGRLTTRQHGEAGTGGGPAVYRGRKLEIEREFP